MTDLERWCDYLLVGMVALTYTAYAAGWAIPVIDDARGATLLIGAIGLTRCIVAEVGA